METKGSLNPSQTNPSTENFSDAEEGTFIKSAIRTRPMSVRELQSFPIQCTDICEEESSIYIDTMGQTSSPSLKCFHFDNLYGEESTTQDIYEDLGRQVVDGVLNGVNGAFYAYGQTGSGKKFTLYGADMKGEEGPPGFLTLAVKQLFEGLKAKSKYLIRVQFFEIYMEQLNDLLNSDWKQNHPNYKEFELMGTYEARTPEDVFELFRKGHQNMILRATMMSAMTSRSHQIFNIRIESIESDSDQMCVQSSVLSFIKLAGSERVRRTQVTGQVLREAVQISRSLSSIGNVISAVYRKSQKDEKVKFIPYRDSKLTFLCMQTLGGNCNTVFIGTISPCSYNVEESLSSIRYMDRVKRCINYPKRNINSPTSLLMQFQRILDEFDNEEKPESPKYALNAEIELKEDPEIIIEKLILKCTEEIDKKDQKTHCFVCFDSHVVVSFSNEKLLSLLEKIKGNFVTNKETE